MSLRPVTPAVRADRRLPDAFWAGAAIAFAGILVSIFLVRGRDLRAEEAAVTEPVLEAAA